MPVTSRIRYDIARATCVFLEQATKWDGLVLAGMLARGQYEQGIPDDHRIVTWEKLTPQKVADALWRLREEKGEEIKAHGLSLGEVITAWDEMILGS